MKTLWLLVVKNWKTTATGVSVALLWVLRQVGLDIPEEVAINLTAFLVSLGLIFAKDGNKTGV